MKWVKLSKMAAIVLVVVMAVSAVIEPKAATGSQVYLYGLHGEPNPDCGYHCSWLGRVRNMYKEHDSLAEVTTRHHSGAGNMYKNMQKANYMMIVTHGSPNSIGGYSSIGTKSSLTIDDIRKGPELSQLKVCLITACNAAPVARAIKERGAKTTIGFTEQIYTASCRKMQLYFNSYFTSGQTVTVAMHNACNATVRDLKEDYGCRSYGIFGNMSQKF